MLPRSLFDDDHDLFRERLPAVRGRRDRRRTTNSGRRRASSTAAMFRDGRRRGLPRHGRARGATAAAGSTTSASTSSSPRSWHGPGVSSLGLRHHAPQRHLPAVLPAPRRPTSRRPAGSPASARASSSRAIAMTEPAIGSDLAAMTHHGHPRRRPLRGQRVEDVHHQRHQRRPGDHRGEDRPDASATRACACSCSSGAWRASNAAATSRRSACTPRTPPSCSSTTCRCRSRTCSATRATGFCHLVAQPAPGAALDRGMAAVAARPGRLRLDARLLQGAQGVRPADRHRSRTAASRWPR